MAEHGEANPYKRTHRNNMRLYRKFGDDRAQGYLNHIEDMGTVGLTEKLLAKGQPRIDESLIEKLREISDDAQQHLSPSIQKALAELRSFFTQQMVLPGAGSLREFLKKQGITLVLYGSLQYDDPHNCDIDLDAFSDTEISREYAHLLIEINDKKLIPYWESLSPVNGKPRCEPHFGLVTNLAQYADIDRLLHYNPGEINDLATPLTGIPLFEEDRGELEILKGKVRPIIESDPFYTILVNHITGECLDERLKRLAEK